MTRYVALLGSINVGGNRLAMADLREALVREDFDEVETVVASGNVLFSHEERPTDGLAEKLAHILLDRFDIDSFAAVRSRAELEAVLAECPFVDDGQEKLVHVGFLDGDLDPAAFDTLVSDHAGRGDERLAPGTRALHVDYVDGVGDSKLTKAFVEKRLGRRMTARNVRSIRRIIEKMG
jgi:uncharacterized protein (DUF1697 family)